MAGQGPQDPDRIDISLDLIGEGSLAAMDQLSEQLSRLTEHLSQFGAGTDAAAAAQSGVARRGRVRPGTGIHEGGPSSTASVSQSSPVIDAAGMAASMPGARGRISRFLRHPGRALASEANEYGQREALQHYRRQLEGLPDFDLAGIGGTGGGYGYNFGNQYIGSYIDGPSPSGVSPGASVSLAARPGQPGWRSALMSNPSAWEQMQEGIRLPPGGLSMNVQDKLRLASNLFGNLAERSYAGKYRAGLQEATSMGYTQEQFEQIAANDPQLQGAGLRSGITSVLLRQASESNLLAGLQGIGMDLRRYGGAAYAYGSAMQNAGVQAGFDRAGQINIPGTNIGITNPLDFFKGGSAAREAINQRINVQRLRMMGGIDKGQAEAIVGGLAGLGWTGEEGQNVAFDAIAPLVQQGQNPGVVTSLFDQAIRNGNTSLRDFRDTMNDLGPSARAARMTLDEYQQSLGQFAEWAEKSGARFNQGMQLGRDLSGMYGMAPQQIQQFADSGFTKSMAMARFGILPNEIAAMPSAALGGMISQGVDFAMQAMSPFREDVVDPNTGKVILRGDRRQKIQAAQMLGVSVQSLDQMIEGKKIAPHMSRAQDLLKGFTQQSKALNKLHDRGDKRVATGMAASKGVTSPYSYIRGGRDTISDDAYDRGKAALNQDWGTIEEELKGLAPTRGKARTDFFNQLNDARGESDPDKRAHIARKLMEQAARRTTQMPDDNSVKVRFTGAAAKWFEQEKSHMPKSLRDANAGGTPINEVATQGRATDYMELFNSQYGGG